jgi:hypothetical protein
MPADSALVAWDGQAWQVDGLGGRLAVMIDLGPWLLLRLQPPTAGRPVWVAVAAVAPTGAWHALRAALYCRVSAAAQQADVPSPSPKPE